MIWISRKHETSGVEWREEDWFFDRSAEDYRARLRCKKYGHTPRIDECEKDEVRGYSGDRCGAPVFYLHCPICYSTLATIDESSDEYRPLLNLEKDGEFANQPPGS